MAHLLAIEIREDSLELIALLNNGVQPGIEDEKTYFIIDTVWNTDMVPQIVSLKELSTSWDFDRNALNVLKVQPR